MQMGPKSASRHDAATARAVSCRLKAAMTSKAGTGSRGSAMADLSFRASLPQLALLQKVLQPLLVLIAQSGRRVLHVVDLSSEAALIVAAGEGGVQIEHGIAVVRG